MKNILFFVVIALFLGCSKQETKVDVEESNAHYQLGIEFAQYRLLNNAVEEFLLAIRYNPDTHKSISNLGILSFDIGKNEKPVK